MKDQKHLFGGVFLCLVFLTQANYNGGVEGVNPFGRFCMKRPALTKALVEAVLIVLIGFVLFNVAFMGVAAIIGLIGWITQDPTQPNDLGYLIFLILLLIMTLLVFRSKLTVLIKASFLCMPVMSIMVMIGVVLNGQLMLIFGLVGLLIGSLLGYLRMRKAPWQYTFSVLYCLSLGLIIVVFNVQI